MKFLIDDNWRWQVFPSHTGKRLPKKSVGVPSSSSSSSSVIFQSAAQQVSPNILTMRIQPNEGISSALKPDAGLTCMPFS